MSKFDDALLLSGINYITTTRISCIHPKIQLWKEIGDANYFNFMSLFTTQPHEVMVELDDKGIDFESITQYDLFKDLIKENFDYYKSMFPIFTNITHLMYEDKEDKIWVKLDGESDIVEFDHSTFIQISDFYKAVHKRDDSFPPKFQNDSVKEVYIEIEREERDMKKTTNFSRLISSLVWTEQGSYKYSEIWDLYMYQLYDGIKTVSDSKDNSSIMYGLYNGTVDTKSISKDRLNWIRS